MFFIAFYLKKTKLKGRTYLSIDESFYSHNKKGTAHKCYKSLGSVETWIEKGLSDPVSHFQQEVDSLNRKKATAGTRKISDTSPVRYLGYFPLKSILEKMHIKKYVDYFKLTNDFSYDLLTKTRLNCYIIYEISTFSSIQLSQRNVKFQIPQVQFFPAMPYVLSPTSQFLPV